jgi:hypothetical protein
MARLRSPHAIGHTRGNRDDGSGPYTMSNKHAHAAATKREPPGQRGPHQITDRHFEHWKEHNDYPPGKDRLPGVKAGGGGLYRPISKPAIKRY